MGSKTNYNRILTNRWKYRWGWGQYSGDRMRWVGLQIFYRVILQKLCLLLSLTARADRSLGHHELRPSVGPVLNP